MRGGSSCRGPFSPMLNVPEMAKRALNLWHYLRGDGTNESSLSLSQKTQELAMIVVAREMDCQFIWNAHSASGRRSGLPDALVDNLRDRKELTGMAPDEAAVVHYGQEFFRTHRVGQATFDAALDQFDAEGGVAGRNARYADNCRILVAGMREMGFETLLGDAVQAPIIVTFRMPADPRFDFQTFYDSLGRHGYVIYPGKLTVAESFRIGCIGHLGAAEMRGALDAIGAAITEMEVKDCAPAQT